MSSDFFGRDFQDRVAAERARLATARKAKSDKAIRSKVYHQMSRKNPHWIEDPFKRLETHMRLSEPFLENIRAAYYDIHHHEIVVCPLCKGFLTFQAYGHGSLWRVGARCETPGCIHFD